MAWEDIAERLQGMGWIGAGLAAVLVAPALVPALGRGLRPAAKGVVKGYLTVADRARGWCAESGEQWQDLVAEAKAEHESQVSGAEPMMTMESPESETAKTGAGATPAEDAEAHRSRSRTTRRPEESKTEPA